MSEEHKNLAWIDIETTGTDYVRDAILEIGIWITDKKLEQIDFKSWICGPSTPIKLKEINSYVWDMHTKSGLWKESLGSKLDLHTVAVLAKNFIEENNALGSPAFGGSVHFDRGFIKSQAPILNEAFHYRNLDVSSIRNMAKFFAPDIYEKSPYVVREGNFLGPEHRTLADIEFSIHELKYFLEHFKVEL